MKISLKMLGIIAHGNVGELLLTQLKSPEAEQYLKGRLSCWKGEYWKYF